MAALLMCVLGRHHQRHPANSLRLILQYGRCDAIQGLCVLHFRWRLLIVFLQAKESVRRAVESRNPQERQGYLGESLRCISWLDATFRN